MSSNQTTEVGLPAGSKVGKYEILQRLAIGGQAIVYKARDPMLDRFVAIKQISTHLADDGKFLERFQREAQILAKLGTEQSTVVNILDMIQEQRGLFMVMEFVAGHTLENSLQDNPGPVETKAVLAILWRLAAGLHAVHQAGIIHRDLKPGNIIIGAGLKCKIMDFGVAATSDGQTSMVLGTTKYMAPELYESKNVDARADIYSLGFITYEMLLGRDKFNDLFADVVRDKHSEHLRWMKWHGNESLVAPPLHEVRPELPKALSDIVAKMMAKRPEDRFTSMEELGRQIKVAFSPKLAASHGDTNGEKRKSSRRHGSKSIKSAAPAPAKLSAFTDDEPSLDYQPPATAPLPKKRLTLRTKIVLGGAVAACVVAALAVALIIGTGNSKRRDNEMKAADVELASLYKSSSALFSQATAPEAQEQYDQVRQQPGSAPSPEEFFRKYMDEKFTQAVDVHRDVIGKYSQTPLAVKAKIYGHIIKSQGATLQAELSPDADSSLKAWATATDELEKADQEVRNAPRTVSGQADWLGAASTDIKSIRASQLVRRQFQEKLAKAREEVAAGKFDDAIKLLGEAPDTGIPAHRDRRAALQRQIQSQRFETAYKSGVGFAREALSTSDFARANEELARTAKLLNDSVAGSAVSEARLAEMKAEVAGLQKQLASTSDFNKTMVAAEQALNEAQELKATDPIGARQRKRDALAGLQSAHKLQASKELADRVKSLQAEIAYDEGMDYLAKQDFAKAAESFKKSLAIVETPEAKAELDKILSRQKLTGLLKEADDAFDSKKWQLAFDKYTAALAVASSDEAPEIQKNLKESQFNLKIEAATASIQQRKYAEAAAALEEARRLVPERAAEADALVTQMSKQRDLEAAVVRAKDLLKKKDFAGARSAVIKAQGIQDSAELQDLLKQVQYEQSLDAGKTALEQTRYSEAKAYFKQAQSYKDTAEVQALLRQAEEKLK